MLRLFCEALDTNLGHQVCAQGLKISPRVQDSPRKRLAVCQKIERSLNQAKQGYSVILKPLGMHLLDPLGRVLFEFQGRTGAQICVTRTYLTNLHGWLIATVPFVKHSRKTSWPALRSAEIVGEKNMVSSSGCAMTTKTLPGLLIGDSSARYRAPGNDAPSSSAAASTESSAAAATRQPVLNHRLIGHQTPCDDQQQVLGPKRSGQSSPPRCAASDSR